MEKTFGGKTSDLLCRLLFPSFFKDYKQTKRISENRLNHLRYLIHSSYLYETKKEIFFRKFRESVTLDKLKENGLIHFSCLPAQIADYILHDNILSDRANINYNPAKIDKKELVKHISASLSTKDMEILSLIASGFDAKELHVVLDMKHQMSISVKIHRIRKKCMGKPGLADPGIK